MGIGRRQWHPTPVLLPGKSHGWRSLQAAVHGVAKSRTQLSDFSFTFHFHALEKEMSTHSNVLAWRIPGTGEPGGCCLWGRTETDTTEVTQHSIAQHSMGIHQARYWSGLPCPSPGDLPNRGIESRSPTFQADSLLSELPGAPKKQGKRNIGRNIRNTHLVWNTQYLSGGSGECWPC